MGSMYRNVVLTILAITTSFIAIRLALPAAPPGLDPFKSERIFQANRQVLEKRIAHLSLKNMTVGQAIEQLCAQAGVPLAANWKGLEQTRDRPVDSELRDVTFGDAVQFLLCLDRSDWSYNPYPQVEFDVANGSVFIGLGNALSAAPPEFPARAMTVRIYDVRDLLTDEYWGYISTASVTANGESRLGTIAQLVQRHAGLKNWELSGGTNDHGGLGVASMNWIAGRLVVAQSTYGHMRIEAFLARLRSARGDIH
jgi:hypothetical protein